MKLLLGLMLYFLCAKAALSQSLTLQKYENIFLKTNFTLIAEQFNIDAAKAAVIQAKIWENPFFSAEFNAINPQDNKIFDAGRYGQKAFAVQELIYLGGKKRKEIELARTNADIAEIEFKDVLRNLRFQVRTSFFEVYYNMVSSAAFERQLNNLDTLVQAYQVQAKKGNIPLKDVVRLQALYLSLKNEQTLLLNNIAEKQNKLNVFIASQTALIPNPDENELTIYEKPLRLSVEGLQAEAINNRPDFLIVNKSAEAARLNLQWQRSLAVPDLTVGASYDRRGGAFNNQVNVTAGIPVRLWNRNRGNIQVADIHINQVATDKQLLLAQIGSEVKTAYHKYMIAAGNYAMLGGEIYRNFEVVYNGVYQNFQKRNISLIEFTDFMESYNKSLIQFNEMKNALIQACEEINYTTGTSIF